MASPEDNFIERIARLSPATLDVAEASALLWSHRPRSRLLSLLDALGLRHPSGRKYARDTLDVALAELDRARLLVHMPRMNNYMRVVDAARPPLYHRAMARHPRAAIRRALAQVDPPWWLDRYSRLQVDGMGVIAGQLRLALLTSSHLLEFEEQYDAIVQTLRIDDLVLDALQDDDVGAQLASMAPDICEFIVNGWLANSAISFDARARPGIDWALARLQSSPGEVPSAQRAFLAGEWLARGEPERARAALEGAQGEFADLVRAALKVQAGDWAGAIAGFEDAFARARQQLRAPAAAKPALAKSPAKSTAKTIGRDELPPHLAWYHLLALLGDGSPAALDRLQRYAVMRSGRRAPPPQDPWGFWAHVARVRLGIGQLDPHGFLLRERSPADMRIEHLWNLLLLAWSGPAARDAWHDPKHYDAAIARLAEGVAMRARACGREWHAALAEAAAASVRGEAPAIPFVVRAGNERWRDVLLALQALDGEAATSTGEASAPGRRLVWEVACSATGAVEGVRPLEQKQGVRGWGKATPVPLAKLASTSTLSPWDAKVARAIKRERYYTRLWEIDRAAAVEALVGHPHVVFADAPQVFVELGVDTPEVEVFEEGGRFRLQLTPSPHAPAERSGSAHHNHLAANDADALRLITIVRDAPQRARVIRYTAAQLRAHTLLSGDLAVPEEGRAELQQALRGLARHFRVHADAGSAVRMQDAEVRLRAELSPAGEGLRLRLVAAPLGADGPRIEPGHGRARLLANVAGEALGTERSLDGERAHVAAVLDALPFLETQCESPAPCEWLIDDPELALDAVEALPRLDAHVGVDWPKGTPVKVQRVDVPQLQVRVQADRDWFQVDGALQVDETHVLAFAQLLEAARGRSRYVAMGDGVYVALSRALKQRLADLDSVVEHDRHGHRVAAVAASWLRDLLDGAVLEADAGFRDALDALQRAQATTHALPPMLQASLRSYQEDGFRWAMRLADAGLGGCLADDMGLGKTLQALAVLCARATGGPALVVAPTSVCGNWMAEAARFAPSLRMHDYGSGDREAMLRAPAAMDVLVVSYTLLLQDSKRFAQHTWHTLVLDEAQSIKNPAAKRSVAVFELAANFRLALSGTPVENRLAELWSILRFATPGLLGTLGRFNERFAGPIERERDRERLAVLRRLVAPFVLRRTKAQVLSELPERIETVINVVPEAREAAHYEALRRHAVAEIDRALEDGGSSAQARFNILAQLMRLRRAACDPRLVSPEFAAAGLVGEKVNVFVRLAGDLVANGHKALVFSQFVDFLQLLRDALDAAGIHYQTLDGSTPAAERTRRVDAFQAGEGDLFLISLKAGGVGLNLTAADYVVITDPWWNPAVEDQATGRAHRIGQQRPVTVYRLVNAGTIEERIVDLHREKREIAEGILETGDVAALPSTDELIGLMRGDG